MTAEFGRPRQDRRGPGWGSSARPTTPYDDTRLDPEPGSGVYYLLRAQVSAACAGTFGDSGLATDPRDGLDATSPCS